MSNRSGQGVQEEVVVRMETEWNFAFGLGNCGNSGLVIVQNRVLFGYMQ